MVVVRRDDRSVFQLDAGRIAPVGDRLVVDQKNRGPPMVSAMLADSGAYAEVSLAANAEGQQYAAVL